MTDDDLTTKLSVLTDDRPEPADPAAPIRFRIKRRRRRRRGAAVVLTVAGVTAAALAAGPLLNSMRPTEPAVAGFGAPSPASVQPSTPLLPSTITTPGSTPSTRSGTTPIPTGDHHKILPAPWSAERFTKMPDANAYRPHAYYVAKGTIPTESWAVLVYSREGCLVTDEGPAVSFGRPLICFNPPHNGTHWVVQGHGKEKGSAKIDATLVMGSAPIGARKVRIVAGGKTYTTNAVATPATDTLRFFAIVIPRRDLKITSVQPVNAAGHPVS
ncbi:hypothetical protein E0H75_15440 [Kribbella capetownensis]|uniref:Uncharacterized protein n=1 Tax=Kribbella capetownensis TaxID=1572659 RepID=A0A4V2M812_9ACTN|nr:hypothetical protein [Kribbella capetownensis]TCC49722.1 hypothetical protein E0H75_15440 [Kribbella capetownensis]